MKNNVLRALALCITTALASGYAFAKDDDTKSSTGKPGSASSESQGSSGKSGTSYSSASSSHMSSKPARASKLMNQSIKGQTGESVGQVNDLIIEPTSGQVQFVVLSLSGSSTSRSSSGAPGSSSAQSDTSTTPQTGTSSTQPGTSSRSGTPGSTPGIGSSSTAGSASGNLVAVPWSLIQCSSGSDQFTLNADRTKLQSAPSFTASSWPTMDSSWSQQVYSHFGVQPSSTATGAPGSSSSRDSSAPSSNPSTPGLPSTPGTPEIAPPSSPGTTPSPGTK